MRPRTVLPILAVSFIVAISVAPTSAQPRAGGDLGRNAALRYWQAFAAMPKLDEGQQKLLGAPPGDATDPAADKLLEQGRNALLYLHRGAEIPACDWGLHREDGPYLLLPHLGKARELGRLASLHARRELASGNGAAAVDDVADALVLARHASSDLTAIISYLVQLNIERNSIETVAAHLASLDAASLDRLDRRLASLPPGGSMDACLRVERESFLDWAVSHLRQMKDQDPWKEKVLAPMSSSPESMVEIDKLVEACGGTRQGVLKQFEGARAYYDEAARIIQLPAEQFRTKLADLEQRMTSNPVAAAVMPTLAKVYDRDAAGRTRLTMLRAAVAVVRGGPERAGEFKDAAGAPLTYAASLDGFELRSTATDEGQPVKLTVGGAKKTT